MTKIINKIVKKIHTKSYICILSIILIFLFMMKKKVNYDFFLNQKRKKGNKGNKEHFTLNSSSSSKFDVSNGSSQKYGWGMANFNTPKKKKNKKRKKKSFPWAPDRNPRSNDRSNDRVNEQPENKYIINDFRESCQRCDISKHPEVNRFVLKSSIPPPPDMSKYILKSKIPPQPDMSKYILKSKVPPCPNMSKYILKSKVPPCPRCI